MAERSKTLIQHTIASGSYKKYLAVLLAALLIIVSVSVVSCVACQKPEPVTVPGLTKDEINALDIAGILYAYGYTPAETAAILGNIQMESGGIDYTSMEVYYSARDPEGVNYGHSYAANANEAHTIGPVKQQIIDRGMMGYVSNSRIMLGAKEHYRGGGYFGFSYAGMKELWDFCDSFDNDGDGTPEHYVWWQIPEDSTTPSGGVLQILFSIGFSDLFAPSFTNYQNYCKTYADCYGTETEKIRYYTYAFDLLFELGKPMSHIEPFIPALENFDDPTGNLDQSTPWTSRDDRVAFANQWYAFLTEHAAEIDIQGSAAILTHAGLTPVRDH